MKKYHIHAMYFSGTRTTEKIITAISKKLSSLIGTDMNVINITQPSVRTSPLSFTSDDLVLFGTPVYAGRIPNILLKYIKTIIGNGAVAVPIVLYGNRNYDDALIELRSLLEDDGFHTIAAAAFVGEHSFSSVLAAGRPDADDMKLADTFADRIYEKLNSTPEPSLLPPVEVKGVIPVRPYYQPHDRNGNAIDIRKVLPKISSDCNCCGRCADICPMGSISHENIHEYTGICIKCCACVKLCPQHARYFDDPGFLYHKEELEYMFSRRAEVELFY